MSDRDPTTGSVVALYQELAVERAGAAREALARGHTVEGLFAQSATALEDAAGVLLHAGHRLRVPFRRNEPSAVAHARMTCVGPA
jgi:hypothetical protein